jgi:hypothetical protein
MSTCLDWTLALAGVQVYANADYFDERLWRCPMQQHSEVSAAPRAAILTVLSMAIGLAISLAVNAGSEAWAQDAYGGITGPNYPNVSSQSAYPPTNAPHINAELRGARARRSRLPIS